jgi:putative peptide zinc metalloprotease protein
MLKTRDKALISLTALFQAALGIFGFLRMLVRKEIFCNENDFKLLKENSQTKFIFSSGDIKDIYSNISNISQVSIPYLEFPELSSDFGGEIATRQDGNKRIKTEQAYYKVLVDLEKSELDLKSRKTGTLVAKGETESLISKIYRKTIAVLIRESEF